MTALRTTLAALAVALLALAAPGHAQQAPDPNAPLYTPPDFTPPPDDGPPPPPARVAPARKRTDRPDKHVLLVASRIDVEGGSCDKLWAPTKALMRDLRFPKNKADGARFDLGFVRTVGIGGTTGCDTTVGTGPGRNGLEEQGRRLMEEIHATHRETPVDIVAFGLAGLAVRAMLAQHGTEIDVEDVVTIATPHGGAPGYSSGCSQLACKQADPNTPEGKAFLARLAEPTWQHPDARLATDWTVFGSKRDTSIPVESAIAMDADHKTTYQAGTSPTTNAPDHAGFLADTRTVEDARIVYRHRGGQDVSWNYAQHSVHRMLLDLVYGGDGGGRAAGAPAGCTGYSDSGTAPLATEDPGRGSGPLTLGAPVVSVVSVGTIKAYSKCFTKETRKEEVKIETRHGTTSTERTVTVLKSPTKTRVNGIDFVPGKDRFVEIVLEDRSVRTRGRLEIPCVCDHVPWDGPIVLTPGAEDLPLKLTFPGTAGPLGGDADQLRLAGNFTIGKFKPKGGIAVTTDGGKSSLDLSVEFPINSTLPQTEAERNECRNGVDDDQDQLVDAKDPQCAKGDAYEAGDKAATPGFGLKLTTTNDKGLVAEKASIKIGGELQVGKAVFKGGLTGFWDFVKDHIELTASWSPPLPAALPSVTVTIAITEGSLSKLAGEAAKRNWAALGSSGMWLQKLRAGATFPPANPFSITLGGAISAGPAWEYKNKDIALLTLDGDFTYTHGTLGSIKLKGSGHFLDFPIGTLGFEWAFGQTKQVVLDASLGVNLKYPNEDKPTKTVHATGDLKGFHDAGRTEINGSVRACLSIAKVGNRGLDNYCLGRANARYTARSQAKRSVFSICGELAVPVMGDVEIGYLRETSGETTTNRVLTGVCSVDGYHARTSSARAAQAPAGSRSFTLGGGLEGQVIAVEGEGGAPLVELRGPGGLRAATKPDGGIHFDERATVIAEQGSATTYFFVGRPPAGTWTAVPLEGSVPLRGVRTADILPRPEVTAKVARGKRGKRRLRWSAKAVAGHTVTFYEQAGGQRRQILRRRGGGSGTVAFRPISSPVRGRRIVATVERHGELREHRTVARYRGPKPRAVGVVRDVRFTRVGDQVRISWKAAAGAAGYGVVARSSVGAVSKFTVAPGATRAVRIPLSGPLAGTRVSINGLRAVDAKPGRASVWRADARGRGVRVGRRR